MFLTVDKYLNMYDIYISYGKLKKGECIMQRGTYLRTKDWLDQRSKYSKKNYEKIKPRLAEGHRKWVNENREKIRRHCKKVANDPVNLENRRQLMKTNNPMKNPETIAKMVRTRLKTERKKRRLKRGDKQL